jgi:hypothetical protein
MGWIWKGINLFKWLALGNGITGRITGPLSFFLSIGTFLKVYGVNLSGKMVIAGAFMTALLFMFIGFLYDKSGLYKCEQDFDLKRNPLLNEIHSLRDEIKLIKN